MLYSRTLRVVFVLAFCLGCSHKPARINSPQIDPAAAGAAAMEMFDANKDGKLSGTELDKCPGLKAVLAQTDPSGKGSITTNDIAARIKKWQDLKIGRMSPLCKVLHNGTPLAGAEIKFVPEKFLGDSIKTATGVTGGNGLVAPSITYGQVSSPGNPSGLSTGIYRVEITTPNGSIPPKYNTNTILGQEVGPDMGQTVEFRLTY